jgi:hypothetical protein
MTSGFSSQPPCSGTSAITGLYNRRIAQKGTRQKVRGDRNSLCGGDTVLKAHTSP